MDAKLDDVIRFGAGIFMFVREYVTVFGTHAHARAVGRSVL